MLIRNSIQSSEFNVSLEIVRRRAGVVQITQHRMNLHILSSKLGVRTFRLQSG